MAHSMANAIEPYSERPKGQRVGYARVSTDDQSLDLQLDALKKDGCENVYTETVSGASKRRPQLDLCIKELQPGDTLVVWKLDRLGRSTLQIFMRLEEIAKAGAAFHAITQPMLDFDTAMGRLLIAVFAGVADVERELIRERTRAGMQARIARGQKVGAALKFTEPLRRQARKLLAETKIVVRGGRKVKRRKHTRRGIAEKLGISYQTLYDWIKRGYK
jgi:DNA invertase Pin-like site-specific DNA recombinase